MKKIFWFIFLALLISSCTGRKKVLDYINARDTSFVKTVYTNNTRRLKGLNGYNVRQTPEDLRLIAPYNNIIVLFDTIPDTSALRKDFPFARFVTEKRAFIIDNSLEDDSIISFLQYYKNFFRQVGLRRFYATHRQRLNLLKKDFSIDGFVIKWFGKGRLNPKYRRILNTIVRNTLSGKAFVVYFDDTDTLIHPAISEVKAKFVKGNILRLRDGYIFMPVFAFHHDAIDSLNDLLAKYKDIKVVYTDIPWLLKQRLSKELNIRVLPRKYFLKAGKINKRFIKQLLRIKTGLDKNNTVIFQHNFGDTLLPSLQDYRKYFFTHNIKIYPDGLLVYSSFIDTPVVVKKLNDKIIEDSGQVQRIYTNKVYLLKKYLDTNYTIRVVWEPRKCELKDTVCYPKKDFMQRMFRYKLDVEENKAYWIHFIDPAVVEFPKADFVKSYLINSLYYQGDDGLIFTSPYVHSEMISQLKQKFIPLYDSSADFKIYSNKIYVLKHLLDTGLAYFHLPVQYLLPSYEINQNLDNQLRRVKLEVTIHNALVVYFHDPADSVYPSERYIHEKFKYFKFYNFKEGFVIGRYLGE